MPASSTRGSWSVQVDVDEELRPTDAMQNRIPRYRASECGHEGRADDRGSSFAQHEQHNGGEEHGQCCATEDRPP